jgi:hypothetical protein
MHLFFVLNALEEEFRGQLSITGYEGPKEAGYQAGDVEAIEDYLKAFFADDPGVIGLKKADIMHETRRVDNENKVKKIG